MNHLSKGCNDLFQNNRFLEIKRVTQEEKPTLSGKHNPPTIEQDLIVPDKVNQLIPNMMRTRNNQGVSLTSIPKLIDTNAVRVASIRKHILSYLHFDVVSDVV